MILQLIYFDRMNDKTQHIGRMQGHDINGMHQSIKTYKNWAKTSETYIIFYVCIWLGPACCNTTTLLNTYAEHGGVIPACIGSGVSMQFRQEIIWRVITVKFGVAYFRKVIFLRGIYMDIYYIIHQITLHQSCYLWVISFNMSDDILWYLVALWLLNDTRVLIFMGS